MIRLGRFVFSYLSVRALTIDHCSKDVNIQAAQDSKDIQ